MAYPLYLREKARELRIKRRLSLLEIAERLALPKTTVYYWIRDLPDPTIKHRDTPGRARVRAAAARSNRERFKALRDAAYAEGRASFDELVTDPTFRDFVVLFMTEGYKRTRNRLSIANSDPTLVRLAHHWISKLSSRRVNYGLQYHADQEPDDLRRFWGSELAIDGSVIRLQRKSNSNQLARRTWRSRWGVLTIGVNDTYLRMRMDGWIAELRNRWLDSIAAGV